MRRSLGIMFGVLLTVAGCDPGSDAGTQVAPTPPVSHSIDVAQAQPDLPIIDVPTYQELVRSTAADGRVLVVDFWATWCAPCIEMFPQIHERMERHGDKVRLVSITLDGPRAVPAAVDFLQTHHALPDAWRLFPDTDVQIDFIEQLNADWNDLVVPVILIYDSKGNLAAAFINQSVHDTVEGVSETVDRLTAQGNKAHAP